MKTVLITGVHSGHGLELVKLFLKNNWFVIGISKSPTNQFQARLKSYLEINIDLLDVHLEDKLIEHGQKINSPIDLVINNAGMPGKSNTLANLNKEDFMALIELHAFVPLIIVKTFLKNILKSETPTIVNISSRLGSISNVSNGKFDNLNSSYSMRISKAAQNMASACLFTELKNKNVSVYALNPGLIKTKLGNSDANLTANEAAENTFNFLKQNSKSTKFRYSNNFNEAIEF